MFISIVSQAQENEREYFDKNNQIVDKESSYYYRVGKKGNFKKVIGEKEYETESYSDTVYVYFTKSNTLKAKETYDTAGYRNGISFEYYEDGSLKEKGPYVKDKRLGYFTSWYPDGKKHKTTEYLEEERKVNDWYEIDYRIIDYWDSTGVPLITKGEGTCRCYFVEERKTFVREEGKVVDGYRDMYWTGYVSDTLLFKELYEGGKFVKGVRSFPEKYSYNKIVEQASFTEGIDAMSNFLMGNLRYPAVSRRKGHQGSVFVQFVVEKDGSLSDLKIVKGVSPEIDREAIRVVNSMPPWTGGRVRGRLVKSRFVLPLKFKLG